jgi:hypothetical protein
LPFLFAFSVQLDVEKALDEQLFFEAFRIERFGRAASAAGESEAAGHSGVGAS